MLKNIWFVRVIVLVLVLIGAVYLVNGLKGLFLRASDFHLRWTEEQYVFRGENPADIFMRVQAEAHHLPVPVTGRNDAIDPNLGPADGSYPPYSYVVAAVLTWPPDFGAARIYYGVLNVLLFTALIFWAYRVGAVESPLLGMLLAAAVFATNSFSTSFVLGQYGLIVIAALVAAYELDERGRWIGAGLCLGVAMIKPNLAAPFALAFLVQWRWKTLFAAGVYLVVTSALMAAILKTGPIESMRQLGVVTAYFAEHGYNLSNIFELAGMAPQTAIHVAALIVIVPTIILLYLWRASSLLTLYAIACIGSRFWMYHRLYDNLIIVFLLIPLGLSAWRSEKSVVVFGAIAVAATLWIPGRLVPNDFVTLLHAVVWVVGMFILIGATPRTTGLESRREGSRSDPELLSTS